MNEAQQEEEEEEEAKAEEPEEVDAEEPEEEAEAEEPEEVAEAQHEEDPKMQVAKSLPLPFRPTEKEIAKGQQSWTRNHSNGAKVEVNMNKGAFWVWRAAGTAKLSKRNVQWRNDIDAAVSEMKLISKWENEGNTCLITTTCMSSFRSYIF